jgi:hypothetical protein
MNEEKILQINTLVRTKSRTELIKMCKEKNMNYSGTKHDMAVRLMGGMTTPTPIKADIPRIIIRRDAHGRWRFKDLIFDDVTKNVVGVLTATGNIQPLQRKDIEICHCYKFRYHLPDILDDDPLCKKEHVMESDLEEDEGEDQIAEF